MNNPSHTHAPTEGSEKHKKNKELDREIRNMVDAITGHITDHHKPAGSILHHDDDDDDDGVRIIITLAGSNTGATMRSELDDKLNIPPVVGEAGPMSTYANSNFQAVNNSIMMNSSYSTNDPGVHLDITDVFETDHRHGNKGKKKSDH